MRQCVNDILDAHADAERRVLFGHRGMGPLSGKYDAVFPDRPIVEIGDGDSIFHAMYDLNATGHRVIATADHLHSD